MSSYLIPSPSAWRSRREQAEHPLRLYPQLRQGCGETCPIFPGKRYEDWPVDDPAGQDVETVRRIVDDIDRRVRTLLASLPGALQGPSVSG